MPPRNSSIKRKNGKENVGDPVSDFRSAESVLTRPSTGGDGSIIQRRRSWRTHYSRPKSRDSNEVVIPVVGDSENVTSPLRVVTVDLAPLPSGSCDPSPYSGLDSTFSSTDGDSPRPIGDAEFRIKEESENEDETRVGGAQSVWYRF